MVRSFAGPDYSRLESLVAEGEQFFPAIHGLFLTIGGTVVIKKAMAGAVVAMELVILPVLFELCFVLIDLFRRGRLIVVAKQADHRTRKILGIINRRDRLFGRELLFRLHYAAAPAFHEAVEALQTTSGKKPVPPTGAGSEYADFFDVRKRTQQIFRAVEIPKHLFVGNAAAGPHLGADIFGCAVA